MADAIAAEETDGRPAAGRVLTRCAVGVLAVAAVVLPLTSIAAPAISRADEPCAPGWVWSVQLNECVFWLPTANGPGGPGG
ncbi:hypothetical protein BST11_06575, partial [Mycobacterium alsense]